MKYVETLFQIREKASATAAAAMAGMLRPELFVNGGKRKEVENKKESRGESFCRGRILNFNGRNRQLRKARPETKSRKPWEMPQLWAPARKNCLRWRLKKTIYINRSWGTGRCVFGRYIKGQRNNSRRKWNGRGRKIADLSKI